MKKPLMERKRRRTVIARRTNLLVNVGRSQQTKKKMQRERRAEKRERQTEKRREKHYERAAVEFAVGAKGLPLKSFLQMFIYEYIYIVTTGTTAANVEAVGTNQSLEAEEF